MNPNKSFHCFVITLEDDVPSCIDEQDSNLRWDKSVQLSGWRKLIYPLTRGAWKTYSNVLIKYVWFSTLQSDRKLARRLGAIAPPAP
jgi:hypothetical protein